MDAERTQGSQPLLVRGIVDRFEGELTVIVIDGGHEVLWPTKRLAEGVRPGVSVIMAMAVDQGDTARREREVRDLLQDIFGNG
ncbi:MAG: DUF3006 domain-containing protein [Chloroflexota bacterium]|mgnify:CR=1 FL=1